MAAKAGKDGGEEGLMTAAEMKPLLHLAKRQPMNCAIAMDKGKQGIILLHRKTRSKKLLAELKVQAKAKGLVLDLTSVRFGRVSVDGASDSGLATFTVNKPAPGTMKRALLEQVRPAGLQRCEIVVDEGLENDTDDKDDAGEATIQGGPTSGAADPGEGAAPTHGGHGQIQGEAPPDAPAGTSQGGMPAPGPSLPAGPRGTAGTAGADGQGTTGPAAPAPADHVRARLASLGLRARDALASGSPQADGVRAAATQARAALASGDVALAGQAADTMERLLGTEQSVPAAGAGAQGGEAGPAAGGERGDAGTGSGGPPGPRTDQAAAVKADLLGLAQRIAAADPADRRRLVGLGNQARAALAAGELGKAVAGTAALRQALHAPDAPPPGLSAAGPPGGAAPGPAPQAGGGRSTPRTMGAATGLPGLEDTDENGQAPDPNVTPVRDTGPLAGRGTTTPTTSPGPPLAPAFVGPAPTLARPPVAPPPVAGPSLLSRLAGRALSVILSAEAAAAAAGTLFVAILVVPTNSQTETLRTGVDGHPELDGQLRRRPGEITGTLTIRPRGGQGQPDRGPVEMFLDNLFELHGPGGMGPVLGSLGPEGVRLTPDGEAYLLGRRGAQPSPDAGMPQGPTGAGGAQTRPGTPGMPQEQPPGDGPQRPAWMEELLGIETHDEDERRFVEQLAMGGMKRDGILNALDKRRRGGDAAQGQGGGTVAAPPPDGTGAQPPTPPPAPPLPAEQQLQALPGHGHASHGAQTTLAQQETRLRTRIAPDGRRAPTNTATRFDSHEAELEAVSRAAALLQARDAAGLVPHAAPPPAGNRPARPARAEIVVTGHPGGYGSGVAAQGRGAARTIVPTGQHQNAIVVFEWDPLTGTWTMVTQYPTNLPVTPPPP